MIQLLFLGGHSIGGTYQILVKTLDREALGESITRYNKWCKNFKGIGWSVKEWQGSDQTLELQAREHIAVIEEAFTKIELEVYRLCWPKLIFHM